MAPRHTLATQAAELAFAAPQVIAHRLARIAAAGHAPSARDRREFHRMGAEKFAAFNESWVAMGAEAWRVQVAWTMQWLRWCWLPWTGTMPWPTRRQLDRALHGIAGEGLAPVHRRALANAKRLGRHTRP